MNDSENDTGIGGQLELDADMDPDPGQDPDTEQDIEPDFGLDIEPSIDLDLWPDTELGMDFVPEYGAGPGAPGGMDPEQDQSIDLDADLSDEIEPGFGTEASPDDADTEEGGLSEEELALLFAKRKKRQRVLILVAVIAWIFVILTLMVVNGWGPFAVANVSVPPEPVPDEAAPAPVQTQDSETGPSGLVTAGPGYQDLIKLIEGQAAGLQGSSQNGDMPASPGQDSMAPLDSAGAGMSFADSTNSDLILGAEGSATAAQGISEADVIKTDGNYIYAINSKNLFIVKADGGDMGLVSKIPQPPMAEGQVYFEMYVSGSRLIAIRHGYNPEAAKDSSFKPDGSQTYIDYPIAGNFMDTSIDIFDISNPAAPAKLHTLTQSGDYSISWMTGGYLYLITSYYGDIAQMDASNPRTFVPLYARDGEQYTPDPDDIYLPSGTVWPCYTVITGIDADAACNIVSQKSVYGDEGAIYMSHSAIYLAHTTWGDDQKDFGAEYVLNTNWSETVLTKLSTDSGRIEPVAQTLVPGYILNQNSLDENQGVIRIVTTNDQSIWYSFKDNSALHTSDEAAQLPKGETNSTNALYTLDDKLNPLGSLTGLADGDRVYSCRFIGDTAFLSAYQQAAPLVSVDLSDPAAPKTAGGPEDSGLSDYLYPYADGRLLGMGRNTDPGTGIMRDVKMDMYDNSSATAVNELNSLVISEDYATAEQDTNAILVSADRGLIAFPAGNRYLFYSYDDSKGFVKIAEAAFDAGDAVWAEIRGLIIGDTFYVVGPNGINAYSISEKFAKLGSLGLDKGANSVNRWSYWDTPGIVPLTDSEDIGPFDSPIN